MSLPQKHKKRHKDLLIKALLMDDDSSELPSYLLKQVFLIEVPVDNYFREKITPILQAILKLKNRQKRLKALEDLYNEAEDQYDEYCQTYMSFIIGLEDWVGLNKPKNEDCTGSPVAVVSCFEAKAEVYRYYLSQVKESLDNFSAAIYIEDKYISRNSKSNPSNHSVPIDVNKEFSNLFISDSVKAGFIGLLKLNDYITKEEKWKGVSRNPGELREAYLALESLDLLVPGKQPLRSLKIFYKRFGLIPEEPGAENPFISERALRNKNTTRDYDQLRPILSTLTISKR